MQALTLISEKMAYCRKLLGFSKKEMAKRLSTKPNTLTKYENNTALPSYRLCMSFHK